LYLTGGEPSYFETPRGRRLAWRLAGPSAAYALATALVLLMLLANGEQHSGTRVIVRPGTPAAKAGLHTGDRIAAIDGVAPAGPIGIVRAIAAEPARPLARTRFLLMLLAYPTACVWPISPFVELLLTPRRRRAA
jgi:membrane-associated protease RseP (regulator of RpoE activity)